MMDNMSDMIYFKDRDSRFIMLNKAAAQWQGGCAPEALVGKSDFDSYSEEDARRMREDELRIMETGEPLFGLEERETWKDGTHAWVSTSKMPLRDEKGDLIGIIGISRDITEHKEAEIRAAKYAEENRRFREETEDDLLMAAQLQKTFFPTAYPFFPRAEDASGSRVQFHHLHRAGGLIGGDLCSIRKLSDHEAGIFLCDVMGHGVRAALGTSIVRAMVEELSGKQKDPGRFLQHMNRVLVPLLRHEDMFMYATACYMVLDVSSGRLRFATAGHPPPVYLDAGRGSAAGLMDEDASGGPGLAINEQAVYEVVEHRIHPGDAVLLFTDGLIEVAGSGHEEEYGYRRLTDSAQQHMNLPLDELFSTLYREACRFGGLESLEDDMCLVGFRLNRE
jgi:sigma-B regulation protein RsbU (phosphoserine phosphatase)